MYEYEIKDLIYEWLDLCSNLYNGEKLISLLDYINLRRSSGEVKFADKQEWYRIRDYRHKKQMVDEKIKEIEEDFK